MAMHLRHYVMDISDYRNERGNFYFNKGFIKALARVEGHDLDHFMSWLEKKLEEREAEGNADVVDIDFLKAMVDEYIKEKPLLIEAICIYHDGKKSAKKQQQFAKARAKKTPAQVDEK